MLWLGRPCLGPRGLLLLLQEAAGEAAAAAATRRGGGLPGRPLRLLLLPQRSPLRLFSCQRREGASSLPLLLGLPKRTQVRGLQGRGSPEGGPPRPPIPAGDTKDTSGAPGNDRIDPGQENGKKPNKSQQLKKVFKEYGAVAVAFHVGISLMSLGMFYLAVSSGVDMTAILYKLGFDEDLVQSKLAAGTSTFLLAYAVHKLFAPVRISITLVSVPFLVRYFRKIGFFKPPAPNP